MYFLCFYLFLKPSLKKQIPRAKIMCIHNKLVVRKAILMFTVKQSVIYDWSPNLFMCLSIVITKIDWKVFQWSRASSFTNFMDPPTPMLVCYHVS